MKYIIFDLDDTILNHHSKLTKYTLKTLKKAQKAGYLLIINTARNLNNSQKEFDLIRPDYAIYSAGSVIVNEKNIPIFQQGISSFETKEILRELLSIREIENITVETAEHTYSGDWEYTQRKPAVVYCDFADHFEKEALKILVCTNQKEIPEKIAKDHQLNYVNYRNGRWGRISASSKYAGNQKLFELLSDDHPQDYVFGDDIGDLEMIQKAFHGVLLKNANKNLHEEVSHLTKHTNRKNGVAKYIRQILKKETL